MASVYNVGEKSMRDELEKDDESEQEATEEETSAYLDFQEGVQDTLKSITSEWMWEDEETLKNTCNLWEYLEKQPRPTEEEEKNMPVRDNSIYFPYGQIEPIEGNLGQRSEYLPLVFSTILPSPFTLYRCISFSARAKYMETYQSRLRVLIYNNRYKLKFVCDIGFRFVSMDLQQPPPENELEETTIVHSTVKEYNMSIMVGPNRFHYTMDNEVDSVPFDVHPAPLVFPGDYLEIRGTIDFVSQFHCRSVFPLVWPPQQSRHNMDIFDAYFHYTIGLHVVPGHCFIFNFVPFNEANGGVGFQLKSGPYRQTPLSLFGYFESPKPVEIRATNDNFEYEQPKYGPYFPFDFNKENRVAILMGRTEFQIAINGKFYIDYPYLQSDLPGSITDLKINCDKGILVHCKKFDNSFIPDYVKGRTQLVNFSKFETEFDRDFYRTYYPKPF